MAANIKARRKLSDLYKTGVEVRFDAKGEHIAPSGEGRFRDDDGKIIPIPDDTVAVWIQPPSPLHREQALRDAQAARSRALVKAKRDRDSEEHLTVMAFLADMSDETLVDYLIMNEQEERLNEATRDVLALDEWKDITALQDAMRQFDEMTEEEREASEEFAALMERDEHFATQVRRREIALAETRREALKMMGRPNVEAKALEKRSELVGSQAFISEYEKQMTFYSVRDIEDNGVLFFASARECAEQPDEVRDVISRALQPFIKDGSEAKNSRGVASGSESSELPRKPETSEASTPEESTA